MAGRGREERDGQGICCGGTYFLSMHDDPIEIGDSLFIAVPRSGGGREVSQAASRTFGRDEGNMLPWSC